MASIWRRENSKYWYACYTDESGRQLKKSTKQTDRDKAMAAALELERAAALASKGVATEARFRSLLSEILERVTDGAESLRSVTTRVFLEDKWLKSKNLSKGSAPRYKKTIKGFLEVIGTMADRPISGITPRHVQAYVSARQSAGLAPKTVIVDVKTLNGAFNVARRLGYILTNPVEAVELPRKAKSSRRGTFTPAQVKMLLDASPSDDWRTVIRLAYFTGARLRDCVNMRWDSLDLTSGLIRFEQGKTEEEIPAIPIHQDLQPWLEKIASTDSNSPFLAPSLEGKETRGAHGLSESFKAIMKAAGIDTGQIEGKGKNKFNQRTFHSLRHSFNSAMANAGVSQETRMKLTGHKSEDMNSIYTHHEVETLRNAIAKIPSLL